MRGDEFARVGPDGMEPPRPTDPEPSDPGWDFRHASPSRVEGFVIDHAQATGLMEGLERMALLHLHYTAEQYPRDVREDSARALQTHPGVVLLPASFVFVEEKDGCWEPMIVPQPTPHDARRALANAMEEFWPKMYGYSPGRTATYARAAAEYRTTHRGDTLRADGRCFRVVRTQSLVRVGPDGPERPRPSDADVTEPMQLHPPMDEHGEITYGS